MGYSANVGAGNLTNATAIGANASVTQSNALVLGGTGSNAVNVGIGTTAPAYTLDVKGSGGSFTGYIAPSGSGGTEKKGSEPLEAIVTQRLPTARMVRAVGGTGVLGDEDGGDGAGGVFFGGNSGNSDPGWRLFGHGSGDGVDAFPAAAGLVISRAGW